MAGRKLTLHDSDNWGVNAHPSSSVSGLAEYEVGRFTVACYQASAAK